jgi:hypothetical protein
MDIRVCEFQESFLFLAKLGQGPNVKTRKKYDPTMPTKTPSTKPATKRNKPNLRLSYATSSAELRYPDALWPPEPLRRHREG